MTQETFAEKMHHVDENINNKVKNVKKKRNLVLTLALLLMTGLMSIVVVLSTQKKAKANATPA